MSDKSSPFKMSSFGKLFELDFSKEKSVFTLATDYCASNPTPIDCMERVTSSGVWALSTSAREVTGILSQADLDLSLPQRDKPPQAAACTHHSGSECNGRNGKEPFGDSYREMVVGQIRLREYGRLSIGGSGGYGVRENEKECSPAGGRGCLARRGTKEKKGNLWKDPLWSRNIRRSISRVTEAFCVFLLAACRRPSLLDACDTDSMFWTHSLQVSSKMRRTPSLESYYLWSGGRGNGKKEERPFSCFRALIRGGHGRDRRGGKKGLWALVDATSECLLLEDHGRGGEKLRKGIKLLGHTMKLCGMSDRRGNGLAIERPLVWLQEPIWRRMTKRKRLLWIEFQGVDFGSPLGDQMGASKDDTLRLLGNCMMVHAGRKHRVCNISSGGGGGDNMTFHPWIGIT
ncbi:hypothetical protein Tco_0540859 [Tanacetum coccineum]